MNHATAQPVRFPSRSPHRSETLSGYLDVCRLMARFLRLIDVDIHQEKVQRELFMPSLDRDRAIQLANPPSLTTDSTKKAGMPLP